MGASMQELSRIIEMFESPSNDLGATHRFDASRFFKVEPAASVSWQNTLGRIVEAEIIPRLLLSNQAQHQTVTPRIIPPADLGEFIKLLLDKDSPAILAFVRELQNQGMPLETIFLDVLGSASRYLGTLWEADHCDFIDVIEGLHCLRNVLQVLRPLTNGKEPDGRRAMFMTAPGETHESGIVIVETFFRAAGWETKRSFDADYITELRDEYYEIAGFSLSCDRYLDGLKAAVKKVRQVSKNPSIKILVGGVVFLQNPELIRTVDADGFAFDGPSAVLTAENLLSVCAYV
jgi:methanogenic corrinoid protein MtbC1